MKNQKHLSDRVLVYAIIWCVSYLGSLYALKSLDLSIVVNILLISITAMSFILFVYKYFRSIQMMDEVETKIQLEATAIAFALSLITVMKLGLFDLVFTINKDDWAYRNLIPLFVVFYFIGLFISKRKYHFDYEKHD
ncbi:MAG: hypothetical protein KA143_14430 [Saprospiraceae bacterium]|nr:hypothetical protein [Saprospiraceae bacterium]